LCGVDACEQRYTIKGTVAGDAVSGVTIALSDNASDTTTDSNGDYSFSDLVNGSYTITPSKSGYTFSPTSESVIVSDTDETEINFILK